MAEKIGQAPGDLAVLQSFVNTLDIEQATDDLRDERDLRDWLRSAGLRPEQADSVPTARDLADAVRLRETLRTVLRSHAHHGGHSGEAPADYRQAVADLRQIAAGLPVRLEIDDAGRARSAPAGSGIDAALASILLIASEAAATGTWTRLKACSADDCQWAFYDRSPTRNGCWCSMQICGSRAKSRAYRQRAAARSGVRASRSAHTAAPG